MFIYAGQMLILVIIVGCAAVAMVLANRYNRMNGHLPSGSMTLQSLVSIGDEGLRCKPANVQSGGEEALSIPWSSIIEVAVVNRRELMAKKFAFELLIEGHGMLAIDGDSAQGEAFLAQTHNLVGFDHQGLIDALRRRRPRAVCYSG